MSNVVDDRVVKMRFDNEDFEKGVDSSIKSIDDLEKSLKGMDDSSYGNGLGRALGGIADGVDNVADRFSAWGIVGMEVIQKVTDFALDKGAEMLKALSTDNIIDGWNKYESVNSSVYAIMNQITDESTTFEDVTAAVDKLAWYSDATSFSLSDMVNALKGFMQQGMNLDEAVPIIMGIGNAAMYAGANAKDASGAFNIWAKASANNLSLRQWQQLSLTYGVTTYQFKQMALEAAVAAGTLQDLGDGLYATNDGLAVSLENFDQTLGAQEGKWFTKEVQQELFGATSAYGNYIDGLYQFIKDVEEAEGVKLLWDDAVERYNEEVLGGELTELEMFGLKAAEAATVAKTLAEAIDAVKDAASSGWMGVFKGFFGEVEEAKVYWTELSGYLVDKFVGPVQKAASLSQTWGNLSYELGGRSSLIQAFKNLAAAADSIVAPIKKAWEVLHPPKTINELAAKIGENVKKFEEFTKKLILGEEAGNKLQKTFEAVFHVATIGAEGLKKIKDLGKAALNVVKPIIGFLADLAAGIGEVVYVIASTFNLDGNLWEWLKGPTTYLNTLAAKLTDVFSIFSITKESVADGASDAMDRIADSAEGLTSSLGDVKAEFDKLIEDFKNTEGFKSFEANVKKAKNDLKDFAKSFSDNFSKLYQEGGGGITGTIKAVFGSIRETVITLYNSLWTVLDGHLGGVKAKIDEFAGWVDGHVKTIGNAIKTTFDKALGRGGEDSESSNLLNFLKKDGQETSEALEFYTKTKERAAKDLSDAEKAGALISKSTQILDLATIASIFHHFGKVMGNIEKLIKSAKGVTDSLAKNFNTLTQQLKIMQTEVKAELIKSIGLAVLELAGAMFIISTIDSGKLRNAAIAMGSVVAEIVGSMAVLNAVNTKGKRSFITNKGISTYSSGIDEMSRQMIALAAAMLVMAEAMKIIAEIPTEDIGPALGAMTAIILELMAFEKLAGSKLKDGESFVGGLSGGGGTQIFKMASGLVVMAQALKMLAELNDENQSLTKGIEAVTMILTVVGLFSVAMSQFGQGGLDVAADIIPLAAGLAALALVIKTFAMFKPEDLIQGGVAVAGCLTAIAVFMAALTAQKVDGKQMLEISAAMVVFSSSLVILTAALLGMNLVQPSSVLEMAAALTVLIGAIFLIDKLHLDITMISFGVAVAAFGVGIAGIGAGLLAFGTAMTVIGTQLPLFVAEIIEGLRVLLIGIVSLRPQIAAAVIALVEAVCEAIIGSIDTILSTLTIVLMSVLEWLFQSLLQIGALIEQYWPTLYEKAKILFKALVDAIKVYAPILWEKFKEAIVKLGKYLIEHGPEIKEKAIGLLHKLGEGIEKGAIWALTKFGEFLLNIFTAIGEKFGEIKKKGEEFFDNFRNGISEKFDNAITDITEFISNIISSIGGFFTDLYESGKSFISNFINGILGKEQQDSVTKSGETTATTYKEGLFKQKDDIVTQATTLGKDLVAGLDEGTAGTYQSGIHFLGGFSSGLDDPTTKSGLLNKAKNLGLSIIEKFNTALGEHSESKKTYQSGVYIGEGAMSGEDAIKPELEANTIELAEEGIIEPWQDTIDNLDDMNPTLTPVMDLTEWDEDVDKVKSDMDDIMTIGHSEAFQNMLSGKNASGQDPYTAKNELGSSAKGSRVVLNDFAGTSMDLADAAAHGFLTKEARGIYEKLATKDDKEYVVNNYNLSQNITSPEAVDETTIYRETKSLFSTATRTSELATI